MLGLFEWQRLQIVNFECPRHSNLSASLRLGELHSLIFLGNKGNGLPSMKVKRWKMTRTKLAQRAANGPVSMPLAMNPLCLTQVGRIPLLTFLGDKGNWLPSMKVSNWKNFRTKLAQRAASGPVWMPQALKPLSLIPIGKGKFSQLPLLALWGNKNWLPSMKVRSWKNFRTKLAQRAENDPIWMPQAMNPLCLTQVGRIQISNVRSAFLEQIVRIILKDSW